MKGRAEKGISWQRPLNMTACSILDLVWSARKEFGKDLGVMESPRMPTSTEDDVSHHILLFTADCI